MQKTRVDISKDYACNTSTLFAFLSEHESLARLFSPLARFERLRDGDERRNGVGSARRITVMGLVSFVETYTQVIEDRRIDYVLSGRAPIKNHLSSMSISPSPQGCRLRYTSAYDGSFPLAAFFITPGLHLVMLLAFYRLSKQLS